MRETKQQQSDGKLRNQVTFYASFYDACKQLRERGDERGELDLYRAITQYAFEGTVPELSDAAALVFTLARPVLDASASRSTNARRRKRGRSASGEKGDQLPTPEAENEPGARGEALEDNQSDPAQDALRMLRELRGME